MHFSVIASKTWRRLFSRLRSYQWGVSHRLRNTASLPGYQTASGSYPHHANACMIMTVYSYSVRVCASNILCTAVYWSALLLFNDAVSVAWVVCVRMRWENDLELWWILEYLTTLLQRRRLCGVDKCVKVFSPMRATPPANLICLYLFNLIILGEVYSSWSCSSYTHPVPVRPKYATDCSFISSCWSEHRGWGLRSRYEVDGPGIESHWGGGIFRTRPYRPWGPPRLLYNTYRLSSWG